MTLRLRCSAVLCAADDNEHNLPDDMPGAQAVEDESPDDDAGDHEEHEKDLAVLIAGTGVSLASLKAMDETDRSKAAMVCQVLGRSQHVGQVGHRACPEDGVPDRREHQG